MRRFLLLLGLPVLAAMPFRAYGGESPPAAEKLGDNAALKYWLAFAVMPQLTEERGELVSNWRETPLNGAAVSVMDENGNALRFLHEAAKLQRCDWGLVKEGPDTLLPHLSKARQLARLAGLRVRYRAANGDGDGAMQDLLDLLILSRHSGADGPLIAYLVQNSIQDTAADAAAAMLKRLNPVQLNKLSASLEAFPDTKGFHQAILNERDDILGWEIDRLQKNGIKSGEEFRKRFAEEMGLGHEALKETMTQENVNRYILELQKAGEYYAAVADLGKRSLEEFDRQAKLIEAASKKNCPLLAALMPALGMARHLAARGEARTAMLKAAIAIVLDGPDRVKDFKDPFGDGPFEYVPVGKGFILKSKLVVNDTPVALTVPGAD